MKGASAYWSSASDFMNFEHLHHYDYNSSTWGSVTARQLAPGEIRKPFGEYVARELTRMLGRMPFFYVDTKKFLTCTGLIRKRPLN